MISANVPSSFPTDPHERLALLEQMYALLQAIVAGKHPLTPPPSARPSRAGGPSGGTSRNGGREPQAEEPPAGGGSPARAAEPPAWPDLPLDTSGRRSIAGIQVGQAIQALLADPEITGATDGAGLTPARMRAALFAGGFDASTSGRVLPGLALWLAQAGALAVPTDTAIPWANPRSLTSHDLAALQAMLRATPPPSPEAVAEERGRGLKA
ncbi:MAG: hypothetical protein WCG26_05320 [Chloroflexales bacterium]